MMVSLPLIGERKVLGKHPSSTPDLKVGGPRRADPAARFRTFRPFTGWSELLRNRPQTPQGKAFGGFPRQRPAFPQGKALVGRYTDCFTLTRGAFADQKRGL